MFGISKVNYLDNKWVVENRDGIIFLIELQNNRKIEIIKIQEDKT